MCSLAIGNRKASAAWHLRLIAVWLTLLFLPLGHHLATLIRALYAAVITALYTTLSLEYLADCLSLDALHPDSRLCVHALLPPILSLLAALITVRCRNLRRLEELFVGGWLLWFGCMLVTESLQVNLAASTTFLRFFAHPLLGSVAGVLPAGCVVGIVVGVWERLFVAHA
jgi:hypothetical protein